MIAGVDAYKNGWVVAMAEDWESGKPPQLIPCKVFTMVLKATESCTLVVVDMPIGLPSGAEPRSCDLKAQEALGNSGRSRLFLCPPRKCLNARTPVEFQACIRKLTRKGAGWPVWGIVRTIKEVDFSMTPELQQSVKEFHPELAWKRLAGSLLASKHRPEGLLQRINILNKHKPTWLAALENLRLPSEVKLDDILDSIVGISVAHAISQGPSYKNRFPEGDPPKDERGLRMEIWF